MIDKSIQLDNRKFTVGTFDDSDKLLHAVDTLREKGIKIKRLLIILSFIK